MHTLVDARNTHLDVLAAISCTIVKVLWLMALIYARLLVVGLIVEVHNGRRWEQ